MTDEAAKILVVDDSPQVCKALGDVLKASGYIVRTAPSGERALQILETDRFDLVITDLKMTGMSGMDLARHIFELLPGVPVVILTGFGDMDAVIAALRSGIADFLKKPFSIDEVLSVVKRELARSMARVTPAVLPVRSESAAERPPRVYIFNQRDLEQIEAALSKLRAQATAEAALLVEQAGYVIAAKGLVSAADLESISTLIAGTRTTSASLASLLGETQDFSTSYMEGQRVSVYTTALGRGLYLVIIVPKGTRQGLVWLYAKEAAVDIDKIVQRAAETMQKQLGHTVTPADTEALHQEMAAHKVQNVFDAKNEVKPPPPRHAPRSAPRPLGTVSTFNFKKDRSKPEVVVDQPAKTALPEPSIDEPAEPAPALSFEEAQRLGLLGSIALDQAEADTRANQPPDQSPPPAAPTLTPDLFEAALKSGLLKFDTEPDSTP